MSNQFITDLGSTPSVELYLTPFNKGDDKVYFEINTDDPIPAQTQIRAMILSAADTITDATASGLLLSDIRINDSNNGYYFTSYTNSDSYEHTKATIDIIEIDKEWENQEFNICWLILRGGVNSFTKNSENIYSYPHNVQSSEVTISGNLLSVGNLIEYRLFWDSIYNEDSTNYTDISDYGPYNVNVKFSYSDGTLVTGFPTEGIYYPSTSMVNGISFTLPLYNTRITNMSIPANYDFYLTNISASGTGTSADNTTPLKINIDHSILLNTDNYFKNLDNYAFKTISKNKLKKVEELEIKSGIIDRTRLSININDIAINQNVYVKQGSYISKSYPLDFNIYTFSLKVDEFIPEYDGLDKYNAVKYFIEFNSNNWERISPINRKDEFENNIIIPKIFIFDKDIDDKQNRVKYLNYNSNINQFKLKILFDLSTLNDSQFISPEIRDYKFIIYNKDNFNI